MTNEELLEQVVNWLEDAKWFDGQRDLIDAGDLMVPYGENGWSLQNRIKKHLEELKERK